MKAFLPNAGKFAAIMFFSFCLVLTIHAQTTHNVSVSDFSFSPSTIEIEVGDEVTWTNSQGEHNVNGTQVTFPGNPASFGNDVGTGWTYSFTFTEPGTYDYQCDPHVLMGMTGTVVVLESGGEVTTAAVTIDFSSMNPHLNQDLWLALIDQESGEIIQRINETVDEASFSVVFAEVETGRPYNIDFYADHNGSGNYNAPPEDHAWRLEVVDLAEDTTLTFVHNTEFTDIEWQHAITLSLSDMNPHLGQLLTVFIIDTVDGTYLDTIIVDEVTEADFDVVSYSVDTGGAYRIDFFADHNGNGTYDAPPTDHAWRIEIERLNGDTVVTFIHNTEFTDIFETPTRTDNRHYADLTIYPNPAGDYLSISGDQIPSGDLDVRILNVAGQVVRSMKTTNNGNLVLNLAGLSKGSYFLIVKSKDLNARAKFVKM